MAQNQRDRLIAALAECLYEQGFDETTISMVSKRAGVSKGDFYKQFECKDDCFLVAYDDAVRRVYERVTVACEGSGDWTTRVVDALAALLEHLAKEPAQARLVLVEGLRVGKGVYDRYQDALLSYVPRLREGAPAPAGVSPPEATDEAVVGGIASLLSRRVLAGDIAALPEFLPEVAEFALTPYLGAAEARRIISGL